MILATEKKSLDQLSQTIDEAMGKVKVSRETKLSQFIPWKKGALHHLKFLSLKQNEPTELKKLIEEHILAKPHPQVISRAPREKSTETRSYVDEKKKRVFEVKLKKAQLQRLIQLCTNAGQEYNDLQQLLSEPLQEKKPTLEQVTKWMKEMIKEKRIDKKLLSTYEKLLQENSSLVETTK